MSEKIPVTTYFDVFGIMHLNPNPGVEDSENGPEYTGLYYLIKDLIQYHYAHGVLLSTVASRLFNKESDHFHTTPTTENPRFSHDNFTGLMFPLYLFNKLHPDGYIEFLLKHHYPDWKTRLHPRDLVFYNFIRGGLRGLISRMFLWIPAIAMILSCIQNYKKRNGELIFKTDGKLLTFIRTRSTENYSWTMKLTRIICDWILKMKFKGRSSIILKINKSEQNIIREIKNFNSPEDHHWHKICQIYFKDKNHPITQSMERLYVAGPR